MDGTTTAVEDGQTWIVCYRIRLDAAWLTREARVTARTAAGLRESGLAADGAGRWRVDGRRAAHLDGCLDIDLESSALTNTLPVHRLALATGARPSARRVRPRARPQRRTAGTELCPAAGRVRAQRYRYAAPAFGFTCTLVTTRAAWSSITRASRSAPDNPRRS